ncbi:MAG: hypothetical protein VX768_09760, partial [Planctomycetota bacterium]|nr:hypothetical protein [Planctomycetota bacterium]
MNFFRTKTFVAVLLLCAGALNAQQQPPTPQLLSIFPAGGQVGTSVEVAITEQSELEFADQLIFSHPGIQALAKMRETSRFFPQPVRLRNAFVVTIAPNVPPGTYEVRAQCEYGLSNPRRFVVGNQKEILEAEPNDTFDKATPLDRNSN